MKIYTVGYENTTIDQFVSFLKKEGIKLIVDVRKNPVSRKKGFSKRLLAENLGKKGIAYIHLPGLGMPREWRQEAKEKIITRKQMFTRYAKKIIPLEKENIQLLRRLLKEQKTCLLCFEEDPGDCHRRQVSDELHRVDRKVQVEDLFIFSPQLKLFRKSREANP